MHMAGCSNERFRHNLTNAARPTKASTALRRRDVT
jgi:hypothetical protein